MRGHELTVIERIRVERQRLSVVNGQLHASIVVTVLVRLVQRLAAAVSRYTVSMKADEVALAEMFVQMRAHV